MECSWSIVCSRENIALAQDWLSVAWQSVHVNELCENGSWIFKSQRIDGYSLGMAEHPNLSCSASSFVWMNRKPQSPSSHNDDTLCLWLCFSGMLSTTFDKEGCRQVVSGPDTCTIVAYLHDSAAMSHLPRKHDAQTPAVRCNHDVQAWCAEA